MRERLEQRLSELRSELDAGQKMANQLDAKRADLEVTMLRIAGAIQVMEEMLHVEPAAELHTVAVSAALDNGPAAGVRTS